MATAPKPLRIFLFSHPRSASNLLCKLFSAHPKVGQHFYPFGYAHFMSPDAQAFESRERKEQQHRQATREIMKHATYQFQLDQMEKEIAEWEAAGKIPMFKDHSCYLTQAVISKEWLGGSDDMPHKPEMKDNMLDVPKGSLTQLIEIPYNDPNGPLDNPTILPDRLLKSFAPLFIIRHPAKQVASYYRTSVIAQGWSITDAEYKRAVDYRFSRRLFDYFRNYYQERAKTAPNDTPNQPGWPILVDGDDLISDPEGFVQRFCELIDIDPSGVIYKWEKSEPKDPFEAIFAGTLMASTGVLKLESSERPSITTEATKWEEEWGPEVAQQLTQYAEKALPHYEYLYQFRF